MKGKIMQRHLFMKVILLIVGSVLFFFFLLLTSVSVQAESHNNVLHEASPNSTQGTPTIDPTVSALQKEQLEHANDWFWNFGSTLISTSAVLIAGIFALVRWLGDRREVESHLLEDRQAEREKRDEEQKRWLEDRQAEREKRDEERFQSVVTGLGSDIPATKVGAAIMLRTFLQSDYEKFYSQAFDLAVAHLRLRKINADTTEPLDSLTQALIIVYKETFLLARDRLKILPPLLDATRIRLDQAYLAHADLKQAWLRESSLRGADLKKVDLTEANLIGADLTDADLTGANLSRANLSGATLTRANLTRANLSRANLTAVDIRYATLTGANLSGTNLRETTLTEALSIAQVKIKSTTQGLTPALLERYKKKGADIKEK